ncbi:hypothetical protein CMI39_03110 [Candidatus Pacearchaeota archaeon]|jgi:hypothetical protein|nr:hypothetical protein [Candidatus Pacearchaeota archaeon]|tara:strand:- start:2453 stop:3370 length:918 start_codon:yes stop_codon:yes gene_type:complete
MYKRGYLQISFAWMFAIIVGIFILFLAIFATTKLIKTEEIALDSKTAKEIRVLLNPLETGFESGKSTSLILPSETRIYNRCNTNEEFGRQIIKISQKSFDKWTETDVDVGFSNKYVFSEDYVEGKKFYIFSKPLDFPFKVSDLIYLTSLDKKYCFLDPPENIKEEITSLKQGNILVNNCSSTNIRVCFNRNCEINVNYNGKYIEKNKSRMYFETDALMYAAIFSEKDIYECQIKRLMQRVGNLGLLYIDKAGLVSQKDCNSNLESELSTLNNLAKNLKTSNNLNSISFLVEDINEKNNLAECRLW